jgi:CDP-diacylglycerol--glycerol-3-phosphate 3-phosphatidyltransferase
MVGRSIGRGVAAARDALARILVGAGVSPNALTTVGMVLTVGAGVCLALGAGAPFGWSLRAGAPTDYAPNAWLLLAGVFLVLCAAGDMLDGAVARIGAGATTFGAFLDSTLDRFSDFAVYLGIAFYFAVRGHVTYTLLPFVALFAATMISYTRARAEDLIRFRAVGFWQRGERMVATMVAVFACNVPALLWQQALLPALTVWARIDYTRKVAAGKAPVTDPRQGGGIDRLRLWRYPRGTVPYDLCAAAAIAFLIFVRIPARLDPIGAALGLR